MNGEPRETPGHAPDQNKGTLQPHFGPSGAIWTRCAAGSRRRSDRGLWSGQVRGRRTRRRTGRCDPVLGHIPLTPRAKKVLELSLREALQLGHHYIDTEHILLGIVREREGLAARVLASQSPSKRLVRRVVTEGIGNDGDSPGRSTQSTGRR